MKDGKVGDHRIFRWYRMSQEIVTVSVTVTVVTCW